MFWKTLKKQKCTKYIKIPSKASDTTYQTNIDQCSLGNARISPVGEEQVNSTNGCRIYSMKMYHTALWKKGRKKSEKTFPKYFPKEIKFGYAKFGDTLNCPIYLITHLYTSLHYRYHILSYDIINDRCRAPTSSYKPARPQDAWNMQRLPARMVANTTSWTKRSFLLRDRYIFLITFISFWSFLLVSEFD